MNCACLEHRWYNFSSCSTRIAHMAASPTEVQCRILGVLKTCFWYTLLEVLFCVYNAWSRAGATLRNSSAELVEIFTASYVPKVTFSLVAWSGVWRKPGSWSVTKNSLGLAAPSSAQEHLSCQVESSYKRAYHPKSLLCKGRCFLDSS